MIIGPAGRPIRRRNLDALAKSRKSTTDVIPAKPVSRNIIWLQKHWTPAFAGATTFYEVVNLLLTENGYIA